MCASLGGSRDCGWRQCISPHNLRGRNWTRSLFVRVRKKEHRSARSSRLFPGERKKDAHARARSRTVDSSDLSLPASVLARTHARALGVSFRRSHGYEKVLLVRFSPFFCLGEVVSHALSCARGGVERLAPRSGRTRRRSRGRGTHHPVKTEGSSFF